MSTYDLLLVTPAELVVNPRPFRLEGLKPWNCLTPNGHKAEKSGLWPYLYLITTNINGHEVVNVDALILIAMTRHHLISFAYVSIFALGYEATYISVIPKIPKQFS